MKARIALGVMTAALVTAAPSNASVTIGSTLPAPAATIADCTGGCTIAAVTIPGGLATPRDAGMTTPGVITRFRIRSGAAPVPVRLQVIRRSANQMSFEFDHSDLVTPAADTTTPFTSRVRIEPDDLLALAIPSGSGPYLAPSGSAIVDIWRPPLTAAATLPTTAGAIDIEPLVSVDIEPDLDADGSGDETQDNCVGLANPGQADRDHDGRGDACDVCPDTAAATSNGCPVPASPPPPEPNRAPTVRFRAPLAGTGIGPSFRIVLDVADDSGSPTVSVFDDDGTICVLRRAPYACTWTPTGADVGRSTLLASAVDSAGLSTLGIVRVRVNRFEASLTQRQRHRKGVTRVSGRLMLPAVVTRAQGCRGTVRIRLRKARRKATLTRRCTYAARLPFRPGRARVRFGGNSVIAPT